MQINGDRLNEDLRQLGKIGYRPGKGVTRLALSEDDLLGRRWLQEKMREAGLKVTIDHAANVIGRLPAGRSAAGSVVIGSHLDTVPEGGAYDGALGVLAGLEVARACQENDIDLPWDLQIINFTDEEGHHYAGTFGSRAMMQGVPEEELEHTRAEGGASLREDLRAAGADPDRISKARRDPGEVRAYFELHVEQGKLMERDRIDIGAVTGIAGIYRYLVDVKGEANHAGTTSMTDREDALIPAARVVQLLPEWAQARADDMVATVGQFFVEPGAVNIIPGRCSFSVELRSIDSSDMVRVRERLRSWLEENASADMRTVFEKDGNYLDEEIRDLIIDSAMNEDLTVEPMSSGAGHDAQSFATSSVPTGMIFIPSRGGFSHCPQEYSEPEWVAAGGQVLFKTVCELARRDWSRDAGVS